MKNAVRLLRAQARVPHREAQRSHLAGPTQSDNPPPSAIFREAESFDLSGDDCRSVHLGQFFQATATWRVRHSGGQNAARLLRAQARVPYCVAQRSHLAGPTQSDNPPIRHIPNS